MSLWTPQERATLLACIEAKMTCAETAAFMGRSKGMVKMQRLNHGLPAFAKPRWSGPKQTAPGLHYRSGQRLHNFEDLTGRTFGSWKVIGLSSKRSNSGRLQWRCKCECGAKKLILTQRLKSGGCLRCIDCSHADHKLSHREFCNEVYRNARRPNVERIRACHPVSPRFEPGSDAPGARLAP